jgi:hypothetical protein
VASWHLNLKLDQYCVGYLLLLYRAREGDDEGEFPAAVVDAAMNSHPIDCEASEWRKLSDEEYQHLLSEMIDDLKAFIENYRHLLGRLESFLLCVVESHAIVV